MVERASNGQAMDQVKTILLYPLHATSCNKMLSIADALSIEGHDVAWLIDNDNVRQRLVKKITLKKWDVKEFELKKTFCLSVKRFLSGVVLRLLLFLNSRFNSNLLDRYKTFLMIKEYRQKEQVIKRLFHRRVVDVLLVTGDRHLGYEPPVLKVANALSIPCLIPPVSIGLNPGDKAKRRLAKSSAFDLSAEVDLHDQLPQQFVSGCKGERIGFYYAWQIRALHALDMLPSNPWVMGANSANYLMVRGEAEKLDCIEYGVDSEKLIVTGDPDYDVLYDLMQDKPTSREYLYQHYRLDSTKQLIVVSLPQTLEHKILPEDEHWKLIRAICKGVSQQGSNVLLSLHPKMDYEHYRFLEKEFPCKIATQPLREIIIACDVFIASQGSSTLLWAVLCNIPGVICDWFGLDYVPSYWQVGLDVVNEQSEFSKVLTKLMNDKDYYQNQKKMQKELIGQQVKFDGLAMKRIICSIVVSADTHQLNRDIST